MKFYSFMFHCSVTIDYKILFGRCSFRCLRILSREECSSLCSKVLWTRKCIVRQTKTIIFQVFYANCAQRMKQNKKRQMPMDVLKFYAYPFVDATNNSTELHVSPSFYCVYSRVAKTFFSQPRADQRRRKSASRVERNLCVDLLCFLPGFRVSLIYIFSPS